MSSITIRDLSHSHELDRRAMSAVHGGQGSPGGQGLSGLGGIANVNVSIVQNIEQLQNVQVNALNDIGTIGPNFRAPSFVVSPQQLGHANANVFL